MSTRPPIKWHAHPTSTSRWPLFTAAIDFAQLTVEQPSGSYGLGMWHWSVRIDGEEVAGGGTGSEADSKMRAEEAIDDARARGVLPPAAPDAYRPARLWARTHSATSRAAVHALGPTASTHVDGKAVCGMVQARRTAYRGWEPLPRETPITCVHCRKALGVK